METEHNEKIAISLCLKRISKTVWKWLSVISVWLALILGVHSIHKCNFDSAKATDYLSSAKNYWRDRDKENSLFYAKKAYDIDRFVYDCRYFYAEMLWKNNKNKDAINVLTHDLDKLNNKERALLYIIDNVENKSKKILSANLGESLQYDDSLLPYFLIFYVMASVDRGNYKALLSNVQNAFIIIDKKIAYFGPDSEQNHNLFTRDNVLMVFQAQKFYRYKQVKFIIAIAWSNAALLAQNERHLLLSLKYANASFQPIGGIIGSEMKKNFISYLNSLSKELSGDKSGEIIAIAEEIKNRLAKLNTTD